MITELHRSQAMGFAMARLASLLRDALAAVHAWHAHRKDAEHLAALSDHHLKDIGLHRSQIMAAVHGRDIERMRRSNAHH